MSPSTLPSGFEVDEYRIKNSFSEGYGDTVVGTEWSLSQYGNEVSNRAEFFSEVLELAGPTNTPAEWSWFPFQWTWWVILQLIFALLGIVGNLLVMVVLFHRNRVRRSTDTLIGALAIADFATSVFLLPIPIIKSLPSNSVLAGFYCKVVHTSLLMWVSVVASIFILAAISIERYIAIAYPLYFRRTFSATRTRIYIILIWVAAFAANGYQFVVGYSSSDTCMVGFSTDLAHKAVGIFIFTIEFVAPAVIMILAQIKMVIVLQKQTTKFSESKTNTNRSNPTLSHVVARKRILQMLIMVVTVFIICWGPDQTMFLALHLNLVSHSLAFGTVYRVLVILAFINSCANPIIYTIRYPQFREAIRNIFKGARASQKSLFDIETTHEQQKTINI
ncbi:trace amine-associated receptor 6-like [Diadema antillarum]|uniref:trace amine-associated receptor 6-like n=1 Tax=Diadema antillarum TaxID=105358 RepID=UPI003A8ADDA0